MTTTKEPLRERAIAAGLPGSAHPGRPPGPFPVSHSTLAGDSLLAEVAGAYAIETPTACHLLKPGSNDTYLLTTRDRRYVARVYRLGWRTTGDIACELDLLRHLAGKGVAVSAPIPAADGALMRPLSAPEGTRQMALFPYLEGRRVSWAGERHCYLAGRILAQVHTAADDFATGHRRFRLDLPGLTDSPLAAIRPLLAHRVDDFRYLQTFAARLRAETEAVGNGLYFGMCHGDFGPKNIHIHDGSLAVLDFDHCGVGWRVYDFASIYRTAEYGTKKEIWGPFLEGYNEIKPLADADLAAVPLLRVLRDVYMLGVFAANVSHWGAATLSDRHLDGWLASFRQWEADHPDRRRR